MRPLAIALVCAGLFSLCALHVEVGPTAAHAGLLTAGDSALAAAGTFKIYPLFTNGGAHIHNPQHVTLANGYAQGFSLSIYSSAAPLRVNIYGPAGIDSSGFTIPAGGSFSGTQPVDSVLVLSQGAASTVTWRVTR